jgi:sulfate adenylyltransferase subunit 1 (EFTu-like GTPase family)
MRNSNAVVELQTSHPISIELYRDIKELGRFMLRVGGVTVAAGLVTQVSTLSLILFSYDMTDHVLGSLDQGLACHNFFPRRTHLTTIQKK